MEGLDSGLRGGEDKAKEFWRQPTTRGREIGNREMSHKAVFKLWSSLRAA